MHVLTLYMVQGLQLVCFYMQGGVQVLAAQAIDCHSGVAKGGPGRA